MKSFKLKVYESDSVFLDLECVSLVVPTMDGSYGILADHLNMIAAVVPGTMEYTPASDESLKKYAAVSNGMIKVENNTVLVLVESAEHPDEIDAHRAQLEAEQAKEEILQKRSIIEYRSAEAQLARAMNRLKVKGKYYR